MLTDRKALGFKDVLIVPQASDIRSRKEVSLERTFTFRNGLKKTFVPIMAANMANIGTFKVAQILSKYKMITCLTKETDCTTYYKYNKIYPEIFPYLACTVGLHENDRLSDILRYAPIDMICLDVANGYMKDFVHFVLQIRAEYPNKIIIAGNVATAEGALALYRAGADIVKIGLGSGSVCTTRYKTGVGIPQITAIDDCFCVESADLPLYHGQYGCSDGGCISPGDVAKAFVAGADFVMLGGMLAGHSETGTSLYGSALRYDVSYRTSEGKAVDLNRERPLEETVKDILGGLRSTGSYIGQRRIEDFYKADLIQVQEQTNDIFGAAC